MVRVRRKRMHKNKKAFGKGLKTKRYQRDIDQRFDDITGTLLPSPWLDVQRGRDPSPLSVFYYV